MDNKEFPEPRYIGQIWLAVNYYRELLHLPIILTGDFNSNKIWDEKNRVGNHTYMVSLLEEKNIHSVYHFQEGQEQGKEKSPTFYMYRKHEKPYHIDYFFASKELIEYNTSLIIGKYEEWCNLSDHVPFVLATPNPQNDFEHLHSFSNLIISLLDNLSGETKIRFKDVIQKFKTKAETLNDLESFTSIIEERKDLTTKIDQLTSIDELIEKL